MDERRHYNRVTVDNHAILYDCAVIIDGNHYPARLIDISQGGAKLEIFGLHSSAYMMKGNIVDDYYDEPYLAGKYYTVAWQDKEYIGVSFAEPLSKDYGSLYDFYAAQP